MVSIPACSLILFFKADQVGLFETVVPIKGHATRRGTFVAPHVARRRKRLNPPESNPPKPATLDLFASPEPAPAPPDRPKKPRRVDSTGDLFANLSAELSAEPATESARSERPPSSTASAAVEPAPATDPAQTPEPTTPVEIVAHAEAVVDRAIDTFGVRPGTSKAQRREINARCLELLARHPDAYSDADRALLRQYSGNGGCGDSLNEFYTRPDVAAAMWTLLETYGFKGGAVMEPSCATGVFLHTAPETARVTGVELDPTSATIARILHGDRHEVQAESLESFATQDGRRFQAVIGNVPFGLRGDLIKDDKPDLTTAENYFLDTALDKCEDQGLVCLIVPTGILDAASNRAFRERLLRKAEFLGAHRLPNTAFAHSHTGVTTDIVLFRKRPQDVAGALATVPQDTLRELAQTTAGLWDAEFLAGDYFTGRGRDTIYGTLEAGWRSKAGLGHDITVSGAMAGVAEALAGFRPADTGGHSPTVGAVLAALGDNERAKARAVRGALKTPYPTARVGDTRVINGITYILQGQPPRWHRVRTIDTPAIAQARPLADAIEALAHTPQDASAREQLHRDLDAWIQQHGHPGKHRDLKRAAAADPGLWRLIGAVRDDGGYSDLIAGTPRETETASVETRALHYALHHETFAAADLAGLLDWTDADAAEFLYASPQFAVLEDGRWTQRDRYLSGELWPKLDAVQAELARADHPPERTAKLRQQAEWLDQTIDPQSLETVEITLASGFVRPADIEAWLDGQLRDWKARYPNATWTPPPITVQFDGVMWKIDGGLSDAKLIEKYLNRTGVRQNDLPAIDRLNEEFKNWLLASDRREAVENRYNRTYRGFAPVRHSDDPIAIPGLNPAFNVNRYHFEGLRWALETGKGIVAADVGLGKTGRALMLAKLLKVQGQAKKPMIVVPKSVLANWLQEAQTWFPGAKIMAIGETLATDKKGKTTSKPDDEETRRKKYHQLAQNDYDFVFISQPAWNDLDVDPITKGEYINSDFWVQRGDALGNAGDKRVNQIRTAYQQAIAQREHAKRDSTIHFNDLGVDCLILDEAHHFKNLFAVRSRFGQNPKFLGGSGLSNRAQDTYFKTRWIREQNQNKGVFMLTATPTKNSPLEVYSMLAHVAPDAFERMGIKNSEDFLDRFCEFRQQLALDISGDVQDALCTVGFKNLGELREVMKRFIDRKTAADVGLKLPERDDRQHLVDMTPQQQAEYQRLRALAAENTGDATGEAHIFSIMDQMQKAALDLALLGYSGERSPKMETAAQEIVRGARDGGQVVFIDSNDCHDRMADLLVAQGIPREQIGIINAKTAATSDRRQKIADAFNAGQLKVVIGNTATMGEGINLQKGTTDIHHLDLPWEPASLQQRNGRGLRQGNLKEAVRIHTYLAKGSFDGYRYQTLSAKKDWQDLLWNGGDRVENLAIASASREEMLVLLSADPDAARMKYESNKAAARARQEAEQRADAGTVFVKFQQMQHSLETLKAGGARGQSIDRLHLKIDQYRQKLKDHPGLTDAVKAALDRPGPAALDQDGRLWAIGHAFRHPGGDAGGIRQPDAPSQWIVTRIDPANSQIQARRYGTTGENSGDRQWFATDDLHRGLEPIEYDPQAEAETMAQNAIATRYDQLRTKLNPLLQQLAADRPDGADALWNAGTTALESAVRDVHDWTAKTSIRAHVKAAVLDALYQIAPHDSDDSKLNMLADSLYRTGLFAHAGLPADIHHAGDLKGLSDAVLERYRDDLQAHLLHRMQTFDDRWNSTHYPIIQKSKPALLASYHGSKWTDPSALVLPTTANRQKAIDAYVDLQRGRHLAETYSSKGHRYELQKTLQFADSDGRKYPSNPWLDIGTHLWGETFTADATNAYYAALDSTISRALHGEGNADDRWATALASSRIAGTHPDFKRWDPTVLALLGKQMFAAGLATPERLKTLIKEARDQGHHAVGRDWIDRAVDQKVLTPEEGLRQLTTLHRAIRPFSYSPEYYNFDADHLAHLKDYAHRHQLWDRPAAETLIERNAMKPPAFERRYFGDTIGATLEQWRPIQ